MHPQVAPSVLLARPQEATALERAQHVVQVDPGLVTLGVQRSGAAGSRVKTQNSEVTLVAALHLCEQRAVVRPVHAGEVEVVAVRSRQIEPCRAALALTGRSACPAEADLGVGGACEGVTEGSEAGPTA
eukprot:scaffold25725_cov44-Phaeocystis_antarctica.AAC.2